MSGAHYPLHPGKHTLPAVPDPGEHAAYVRGKDPDATLSGVHGVLLVHQARVLAHAADRHAARWLGNWTRGDLYLIEKDGGAVALCGGFGPGAPAAALVVEQLIVLGADRVITVGTAAALHEDLPPGTLVVCDKALRDEGTSHHYLPHARYAHPGPPLTRAVEGVLRARGLRPRRGPTWTTDALYRETRAEVTAYVHEGVLTADMEAAAVFSVAQFRSIEAAAVFTVADSLAARQPRQDTHPVHSVLQD
ncbi:nucleoside phosphorylase, partial [Streptomyces sp. NPDC058254]|uniref:nucleoside phosphorylase n=1 Tax=Streptomyces sp. NPDC058254 TaxID=3346406 RepID=UPI0036E6DBA5